MEELEIESAISGEVKETRKMAVPDGAFSLRFILRENRNATVYAGDNDNKKLLIIAKDAI